MAPKNPNLELVDFGKPKPNKDLVKGLKALLELAKSGKLRGLAGVGDLGPSMSSSFILGNLSPMEIIGCLHILSNKLADNIDSRSASAFEEID